jgi:hypothetical protein
MKHHNVVDLGILKADMIKVDVISPMFIWDHNVIVGSDGEDVK